MGASLQYGLLQGTGIAGDDSGDHFALSGHMKNALGNFTLYSQLTYYVYSITDDTPWSTGDVIPMGAYDFAWPVASEGVIPALSLKRPWRAFHDGVGSKRTWQMRRLRTTPPA